MASKKSESNIDVTKEIEAVKEAELKEDTVEDVIIEDVKEEDETVLEEVEPVEEEKKPKKTAKSKVEDVKVFKEKEESVEPAEVEKVVDGIRGLAPEKIDNSILTIDPNETMIDSRKRREDALWHDLTNAVIRKKEMTGIVESVEKLPNGVIVVSTSYEGQRIVIPLSKMGIVLQANPNEDEIIRLSKLANAMLGAEIDYVIAKAERSTGAVIASREAAMLSKIKRCYGTFKDGVAMIYPGRAVQARIVGVAEKKVRCEIFGIETSIHASDMSWEWVGDLRDTYEVGDKLLVNITDVVYPTGAHNDEWLKGIRVSAEAKSLIPNKTEENFSRITEQGKYVGEITDIHDRTYFIRLDNGVNAISHEVAGCAIPLKKDRISFACTRKDYKTNVAIGIITRVIKTGFGK